ncbi:MAG: glycosyltransferase, partial [Betaproteobacteria bacterium]
LDPKYRYLGIVATLRSWKGHQYLLEAFAQLDAPGWKLLIIGEGPQTENIQAKIVSLNLHDKVLLVGQKTDPETWMQALDIFCLPSYANEGVPQSIMQAMLTGLPIVTTPVGAILEAVDNHQTALVVPPMNVLSLSEAIGQLMTNPELAEKLGREARQQGETRFSLQGMLLRMEQIFLDATKAA